MEILSSGEKIKKVRKSLNLKQKDVVGTNITRELLSLIETNKATLTPSAAKAITDNINRICKEKNLNFTLDIDYILKDTAEQAREIANQYLKILSEYDKGQISDFIKDIKSIEHFLLKYDVGDIKLLLYDKIGDIFKNKRDYNNSYLYYIKAYESHNNLFDKTYLCNLLQKLASISIRLNKDREALNFNELAWFYSGNVNNELKYKILFNNMLAYIHLKEFDNALNEYDNILTSMTPISTIDLLELNVLKANCLRHKKHFSDALLLNKEILRSLSNTDIDNQILTTSNILDIYTILMDTPNIRRYINKLSTILNNYTNNINNYQSSNAYNQLGQSSVLLNDTPMAISYYKKSISISKKIKNKTILYKSLSELLDILIAENITTEIALFKNQLLELIALDLIESNSLIIFKLISHYNKTNDKESLQNMVNFILDSK